MSLLQPVALARPTRKALRRQDVLPALRTRLLAAVPGGEVTPAQLERIRPRTLLTLIASASSRSPAPTCAGPWCSPWRTDTSCARPQPEFWDLGSGFSRTNAGPSGQVRSELGSGI